MSSKLRLYLVLVGVLLIYSGIRLFHLAALPLFIDESIIVEWTVQVRSGSPIGFGYHGKYLLPWVYALFFNEVGAYWTVRVVTIFFLLIGASAILRLAKQVSSWSVGIVTVLVMTFTPMIFFFDRMALTDTILHAMLSLFALSIFLAFDTQEAKLKRILWVPVTFILAVLAKSTAFVLIPLPLLATFIVPRWTWLKKLQMALVIYGGIFILWLPLQIILTLRGINYFGLAGQFSSGINSTSLGDKLLSNAQVVFEGLNAYFGVYGIILVIVASLFVIVRQPRYGLILFAMIAGFLLALILAAVPGGISNRYWLGIIPIALLMLVLALNQLAYRYIWLGLLGLIVLFVGLPFIWTAYFAPTDLALPRTDRLSYIELDASGSMLPELAQFIDAQNLDVLVAIPQCFSLDLYTVSSVECFNVVADNQRIQRLTQRIAAMDRPFLIIFETPGYVTTDAILDVNAELLTAFVRPGALITIEIYRVNP